MATAYHMEALRKQRVLERAVEARRRMQEKEEETMAEGANSQKEKKRKHHHHHHKRSNRPASAQKITSSPKKSKMTHSPSPSNDKMDTSSPPSVTFPTSTSVKSTDNSKKSSRCSSASQSECGRASSVSVGFKKLGDDSVSQSRPLSTNTDVAASQSQAETITVSRCSKCRSSLGSTASSRSTSTCSSRSSATGGGTKKTTSFQSGSRLSSSVGSKSLEKIAELKAEAVRKDLHQQELVLRDSNLVMGNIPVEEEITLRALERQKLDATT